MRLSEQGMPMKKYKSKTIQAYSEPCVTLVYSQPLHIQNQRHSSVKIFCPAHKLRMKCISKTV